MLQTLIFEIKPYFIAALLIGVLFILLNIADREIDK